MRATQTRLVVIALLSLSLGACSSILPKRASEPYKNGAKSPADMAAIAPAEKPAGSASIEATEEPASVAATGPAEPAPQIKPSVVVLVKGARSRRVRRMVQKVVAKNYELVPGKRYYRAARRLRARRMKTRHVAKVASRLGADAVLHGALVRKGKRRYKLHLRLRDGDTGKTLERFTLTLRSRRLRKRHRRELASRVRPVLDQLASAREDASRGSGKEATGRRRVADATPTPEVDDSPALVERVDDRGQVIDGEVPDILR